MVIIRLTRKGKKKHPFYRIIVTDSRMPRDGRFIEQIGTFNPFNNKLGINLNIDKISYWLKVGAKTSKTVYHLIKKYKKQIKQ